MSEGSWPVIEVFPERTRPAVQLSLESYDGGTAQDVKYHTSDLVQGEVIGGFAERHPGAPGVLIVYYVVRALQDATLSSTNRQASLESGRAYVVRQQQKEGELNFRRIAEACDEYPMSLRRGSELEWLSAPFDRSDCLSGSPGATLCVAPGLERSLPAGWQVI